MTWTEFWGLDPNRDVDLEGKLSYFDDFMKVESSDSSGNFERSHSKLIANGVRHPKSEVVLTKIG